jgi:aminoglycoside phosphotransferase family enzyme
VESFILGTIARRVLQSTDPACLPPPVQDELKQLVRQGYVTMPVGLEEWLLDSWQQAGKFSNESEEELARMLVKLYLPARDPDLLKAFAQDSIEEQSHSRESNAETIETDTKSRQDASEGTMPDSVADSVSSLT